MAIALDATTGWTDEETLTTSTFSHTCTGSNRILFVMAAGNGGASNTILTVTYALAPMTSIGNIRIPSDRWINLFYLIAPATGANNVVITASASSILGASTSFTGASQTGQPDSSNSNSGSAITSLTTSTTVVASNCWLVGIGGVSTGTPTGGSGTTIRNSGFGVSTIDSNATVGTGSQSLILNNVSSRMAAFIASFSPVGAGAATPSGNLMRIGMGF